MNKKVLLAIILASMAAGYLICNHYCNHETEKIVTKDRIITHEHTVIAPDGTITTDKDVVENKRIQDEISKSISATQTQWRINGGISVNTLHLSELIPAYELGVDRRILGPVWLGIRGSTRGDAALNLAIEF